MRNSFWKPVVLLGILMILSAGLICVNNIRQSREAGQYSGQVIEALKNGIPQTPEESIGTEKNAAEDLFAPYEEKTDSSTETEPAAIEIDGASYCGYLTLPSLDLELPVMSGWSYPNLRLSPCRYSGTAPSNDLIIAAHNYHTHFGRIGELQTGDEIIFTDANGRVYRYAVAFMEIIEGQDIEQMFSGQSEEWDLTLFTCTLSGQSRVTVRADRQPDGTENQTT